MAIIKLHKCYLTDSNKVKYGPLNTMWLEWTYQEIYINPKYIIRFEERNKAPKNMQECALNKENFNTIMWIDTVERPYYIKETTKQIMKLIGEEK